MHIAIVAEPFLPVPPKKYGGTERVIYWLIKGLQEQGHEVTLLAAGDSKVDCRLLPIAQQHIQFGLDETQQEQIRRLWDQSKVKTAEILRKITPHVDIIHSHGFDLLEFKSVPNLTTYHGTFTMEKMPYFLKRKSLYFASISKNQQAPIPQLKFMGVSYNGLNPDDFPLVTIPKNYVTFIGRLDEEKSPHLAIELAIALKLKIIIAGKVDFQGSYYFDKKVKPLLTHPLVEYIGEIGMKEKKELLSNAMVNLHPTNFREPFGLTVLEAAYCGTPTIAINRGSMPELIEEGRTGILVEDFHEAYHKLKACFTMDRSYIALRSRRLFNYQNMASSYVKMYEKVIDIFQEKAAVERLVKEQLLTRPTVRHKHPGEISPFAYKPIVKSSTIRDDS